MTTENAMPEPAAQNAAPPADPPGLPVPAEPGPEETAASESTAAPPDEAPSDEAPSDEASSDEASSDEAPPATPETPEVNKNLQWYVVKVQSGREESIKEAIERRVKIEGLQDAFGQVVIPTEKVSEMRKGKRYVRERKLLPGYLMVQVEFNEHMLYLFRETSGVGDFVGAGLNKKPLPMSENEIKKWIGKAPGEAAPTTEVKASPYSEGDRVKVKDGMFAGMEGSVKQVLEAKGAVTVELTIFGRPVPVGLNTGKWILHKPTFTFSVHLTPCERYPQRTIHRINTGTPQWPSKSPHK
jgi:transcription termination/antitermination protein NusG